MRKSLNPIKAGAPRSFSAFVRLRACPVALAWIAVASGGLHAQAPSSGTGSTPALDTLTVYGESENDGVIQSPFLSGVEGGKIFSGKRATVIDLDALPKVQANNYRQALAFTPGLLFSEETTPLVSLGYRGVGEPHRMQFLQVLKDGIPIHADPFGYPEAYYTPPLDVVDRIEFIRGGGSLMYGAQPAGVLNYVTHEPPRDRPLSFRTQHIFGTDNLYSNYTSLSGTSGNTGYYGYYNHRQADGFREENSDYQLDGGLIKLMQQFSEDTRMVLTLDLYEEEHGEPGGLSVADAAATPAKTNRRFDRLQVRRYAVSADLQHRIQAGTELSVKTWAGYYDRLSFRQKLDAATQGTNVFGVAPLGSKNAIERQEFYSLGFEPRLRHNWDWAGGTHTLAGGIQLYGMSSPRQEREGHRADARTGVLKVDIDRTVLYGAAFAENKFTFGNLSVTPGVRFEAIDQELERNSVGGSVSSGVDKRDYQPLFGLGVAYDLPKEQQFYANVSQSYRATIFSESIVAAPGLTATNADPGLGWNYEVGFRGRPWSWMTYDTSVFLIDLDNRFGVANDRLTSVGRSINYGWDAALQVDVIGVAGQAMGEDWVSRYGSLNLYGSLTLLEARLYGGPNNGGTPQYAPARMLRTGLVYGFRKLKVSFLGTFMGEHNARDDANPNFAVPAYQTWDLTAEIPVSEQLTIMAGINNLFDEEYYARVRADGIDPAYGRNVYVGASLQF
jgi:Fe(3+) dicitrate transport protein